MVDVSGIDFDGIDEEWSQGEVDDHSRKFDSIDFDQIAEAASILIASFLYHNADSEEKLATLLYFEHKTQEEYLEEGLYKPTIIRQAAFIEYFLIAHLVRKFEEEKGEPLSNQERTFINHQLGNSGRQNLISMFGILSEQEEQAISELMSARNDIAHNPWIAFEEDAEKRFERTATRMHQIFEDMTQDEDTMEEVSETVIEKIDG